MDKKNPCGRSSPVELSFVCEETAKLFAMTLWKDFLKLTLSWCCASFNNISNYGFREIIFFSLWSCWLSENWQIALILKVCYYIISFSSNLYLIYSPLSPSSTCLKTAQLSTSRGETMSLQSQSGNCEASTNPLAHKQIWKRSISDACSL